MGKTGPGVFAGIVFGSRGFSVAVGWMDDSGFHSAHVSIFAPHGRDEFRVVELLCFLQARFGHRLEAVRALRVHRVPGGLYLGRLERAGELQRDLLPGRSGIDVRHLHNVVPTWRSSNISPLAVVVMPGDLAGREEANRWL